MPNSTGEKKAIVAELTEKLKNSSGGVFVDYSGITVTADTEMRRAMRATGVNAQSLRTLLRICRTWGGMQELDPIERMTALAVSKDPVGAAKIISEYASRGQQAENQAGLWTARLSTQKLRLLPSFPQGSPHCSGSGHNGCSI